MKISFVFGREKKIGDQTIGPNRFEFEIAGDREARAQRYQLELQALAREKPQPQYHNCSFGNPFPVSVPIQPIKGSNEEAISYAAKQLGMEKESVERIWESIRQYFADKNSGPESV